jgi:biopolymer transport protein ExbD
MKLRRNLKEEGALLLTPPIDMIFLVTIFFMLNASMAMNPAIQVDLPPAYTSQTVLEKEIVVTLRSDGALFVGPLPVAREQLPAELKKATIELGRKRMFIQADESIPYRNLVEVMDMARISGIETIALVTSKQDLPR